MNRPCIFDYMDFRKFLKDMFAFKKETISSYSYRYFSRMAGFSSPNFLKLVIEGQRNLTNTSVAGIAKGFKLKKPEREFFENLVFMNQAKDHAEQDHYYRKMIAAKSHGKIKTIETAQYYMMRFARDWIAEGVFDSISLAPPRIAAQLLDNMSKAAIAGFPFTEVAERLSAAWGDRANRRTLI